MQKVAEFPYSVEGKIIWKFETYSGILWSTEVKSNYLFSTWKLWRNCYQNHEEILVFLQHYHLSPDRVLSMRVRRGCAAFQGISFTIVSGASCQERAMFLEPVIKAFKGGYFTKWVESVYG